MRRRPLVAMLWLFLFIYQAIPSYVRLNLPNLPDPNLQRGLLVLLVLSLLVTLALSPLAVRRLISRLSFGRGPLLLLGGYYGWVLLGVMVAEQPGNLLFKLADSLALTVLVPILTFTFIKDREDIGRLLSVLVAGSWAVVLASVYEAFTHTNLFAPLAPLDSPYTVAAAALESRGGIPRVQGTFPNPLALGQYLVLNLPVLIHLANAGHRPWVRLGSRALVPIFPVLTWYTGSRAGLVAMTVVVGWLVWSKVLMNWRRRPGFTFLLSSMSLLVAMILVGTGAERFAGILGAQFGEKGLLTDAGRVTQLVQAVPIIRERPLMGYGYGSAAEVLDYGTNDGTPTVDNYFIAVALNTGLVGLALFLSFLLSVLYSLWRRARLRRQPGGDNLAWAILASALGFVVTLPVVSLGSIMPLFFFLVFLQVAEGHPEHGGGRSPGLSLPAADRVRARSG